MATNKLLDVDLTRRNIKIRETEAELRRDYIAGWALGAKILWDELKPGIDPLGPENILIVSVGPFTQAGMVGAGAVFYEFKSPLTGVWGEARSGGKFGTILGKTGFDTILIRGKSDKPVYLNVTEEGGEIKDAAKLWGKNVAETTDILTDGLKNMSVACIGPAGENQVLFSAIMNDYGRAGARCGGGAVMGSKNLKAVVASSKSKPEIADPETFKNLKKKFAEGMKNFIAPPLSKYGTIGANVTPLYSLGALPAKNFLTSYQGDVNKVNEKGLEKYLIKRTYCRDCVLGCGRYSEVRQGKFITPAGEGPEYKTVDLLGPNCMIDDMEAIIHANYWCNELGLDTISVGVVISFAMEAFEKGYLSKKDTGGFEIKWGDSTLVVKLIKLIAQKEGIGELLARGVKRAAEELTKINPHLPPAEDFACHVKGLEAPAHDPRTESKGFAIQYAISPRGACHVHPNGPCMWDLIPLDNGLKKYGLPPNPLTEDGRFQEVGIERGKAYHLLALHGELTGILGTCVFYHWGFEAQENCFTPDTMAAIFSSIIGKEFDGSYLLKVAERSWNLKRCFNIREGLRRKDDKLPKRLIQPIVGGITDGKAVENLDGMLDETYDAFGWDKQTGKPAKEKLEDLGLGFALKEL